MKGQKGVCLLCRHAFEPRQHVTVTKRLRSSRARAREPYVLPRLVIDLDAADSQVVQKLEDLEDDATKRPEDPRAVARSANPITRKYRSVGEEVQRVKPTVALKTLSTTSLDLLLYALIGDPLASASRTTSRTPENIQFRELFRSKLIQPEDSAETKIQQLTHKFTINEEERLRGSGFEKFNEDAIIEQIRECNVFSKLHRMVSMLSRTHEGCQFLAENGLAIMESMRRCRRQQSKNPCAEKIPSHMAVLLLNNLQLNMESRGVQPGSYICNGGLRYAAMSQNLPAIRKYLEILLANSYSTDWMTVAAFKYIFRGMKSPPQGIDPKKQYKWTEVLPLITGWEDGWVPRNGEQRDFSLAYLCYQDGSTDFTTCLYPRYVMGLGELGLSDTLWAEWKLEDELRFPALIRGSEYMRFRAQMFALAFIVAKDPKRASEVLLSVPIEHDDNIPGNYRFLVQSWQPSEGGQINAPNTSSGEWLLALMFEHYNFHNVWWSSGLCQLLKTTIKDLSKDPVKTLNVLGRFLLVDLDDDYATLRSLDWGTRNEEEGLLINPRKAGNPMYWKPERPIAEPA